MTFDPERYAREVAAELVRGRGWEPGTEPTDVRDDVFNSMTRHEGHYVAGFVAQSDPARVAEVIQRAEWTRAFREKKTDDPGMAPG